jgi:hypothetical protein
MTKERQRKKSESKKEGRKETFWSHGSYKNRSLDGGDGVVIVMMMCSFV